MSEVNIAAIAETGSYKMEAKAPTPMQEMNVALKECKFGWFHYRLLFSALIGFVANVLATNSTAYLLPSAECDLKMNLFLKGLLNAIPYIGMLCSSVLAGFLTDTFGRKKFLLTGYGGIFFFTLVAGSSQSYEVLVTAKFCTGVFFATSFSPLITLTSEFCHNDIRDKILLCQSSFNALAQIIIAAFSWLILRQDWKIVLFEGQFVLNTWNIYLYLCSLWALAAFVLYSFLPESPKYLLSQGKYEQARYILFKIYKENTRKPATSYPCAHLWRTKDQQISEEEERNHPKTWRNQLTLGLINIKPMFRKPLVLYLILLCSLTFLSMMIGNVIRLWFPQLSTIIEHYAEENFQDLCIVLDSYTEELNLRSLNSTVTECVPTRSGDETYINTIILGCVCTIPYIVSGALVSRVGKKPLLFCCGTMAAAFTLGLRWSNTKPIVVGLFSLDLSLCQTMTSLYQTLTIEFFPTTTRSLAISMMMMSGRIGTLVGNLGFPILLAMGCVIPFFTLAGILIFSTATTVLLPSKKK